MSETAGSIALRSAAGDGMPELPAGLRLERREDGTIVAAREDAAAAQLYLAVLDDEVAWGTDLRELVRRLAAQGRPIAPHHGVVLAYLRGDDVASAPSTFFDGVLRVRAGDEVRVDPDGSVDRRRPQPAAPASAVPLARAVQGAVERALSTAPAGSPTVVLGEDLASAALLATVDGALPAETPGEAASPGEAGVRAVRVRAGSTRAQDSSAETGGASRAAAAAESADAALRTVGLTTDRFKKDLGDLVRAQAEPFGGLGVYAHYCALREAAHEAGTDALVLDASGPRGAGLIGSSSPAEAASAPGSVLGTVRERIAARGRTALTADALLARTFLEDTAAAGHLASEPASARDTAAVLASQRNAERFGLALALPLVDAEVASVLAQSTGTDGDVLAPLAPLAAPRAVATEPERLAPIDQHEWLSRLKGTLHQVFRSEQFARRPWTDQRAVLEAFEAHVAGRTTGGDEVFWRLLSLELWMRECVDDPTREASGETDDAGEGEDDHGRFDEPEPKAPLAANPGKKLDLEVRDPRSAAPVIARRYPLQTGKFAAASDMDAEVTRYVSAFFDALDRELEAGGPEAEDHRAATVGKPWNLTISEKIIAIMQGRSYFVWDVQPTWWAQNLSRYVARTPAGIGLGDPVTMQLAIQEAGLPRVIAASAAGAAGKVLRRKGWFYHVVGGNVRAIDGPTEYSVYPANVSAKLPPKDPDLVARHLNDVVRAAVPQAWRESFTGTVVMDANDIGRNTLGKAAPHSGTHYELQFADNPLGQGREQTPMAVVFER